MGVIRTIKKQPMLVGQGLRFLKEHGIRETYKVVSSYAAKDNSYLPARDSREMYKGDIKFSILMPVYNVDIHWLDEAIKSVERQNYTNWELCIVDDCSTDEEVKQYLNEIRNSKIKIELAEKNGGISVATNHAASIANGDYYLLMDNDDEIASYALDEFYRCIKTTDAEIIYSDQDIVDINENHRDPLYKPDWSPDLFLSQMYIGHLVGFKASLFEQAGGFRSDYNGSQDYDLLLRMTMLTKRIEHIPMVLYSWRDIPSSTAANPTAKPYAQTAGLNAIQDFLDKKYGEGAAYVKETENLFVYDVRYAFPTGTKAAIIIPTKDHIDLLKVAIDSIEEKTTFDNYEIVVLNNNSIEMETYEYFEEVVRQYRNIIVRDALFEFNWSKLNNYGIELCDADVYVFLNNDVKVIEPEWLTRLVEKSLRPEVGVVGGLLLYEDGTIQHAGVVAGMGGWSEHVFKGMKPMHYGSPFVSPMVTRNVTACTGACMAVSKNTLNNIGRFDERFIICGSDVELGIRASQRGLYNIYDPNIKLYHYESKSRDSYIPEIDFKMSYEVYTPYRENGDPFYNENLDYNAFQPTIKGKRNEEVSEIASICDDINQSKIIKDCITAQDVKVDEINPYYFRHVEIERKRLNLLVPSINPEHVFGGISTAIKFYMQLAEELGYDQRIILVDAAPSQEALNLYSDYALISPMKNSDAKKQIVSYPYRDTCGIPVSSTDYFVFTGWWTAHCANEAYNLFEKEYGIKANPYIYFIQDFEPGFYAWSTRYMLADATYKMDHPMIAIFNSSQLKQYFDINKYHFDYSFVFEPVLNVALKQELEKYNNVFKKKKRIIIYGRPGTERNAFSLIIAALNKWTQEYEACSEWEIISAGELHPDVLLSNEQIVRSVGKLTITEYSKMLAESYAGISLMVSPHPSYPPLEMATYGVQVITNSFGNKDLSEFHSGIHSLDCVNPMTISEKLSEICDNYKTEITVDKQNNKYVENKNVFEFISDIKDIFGV